MQTLKLILAGGSGQIGHMLGRAFTRAGHECVVLSRRGGARDHSPDGTPARWVPWDGRTLGPWVAELEGADAVINLAGRSVNCRYTRANLAVMHASRVDSTHMIGAAIAGCARPPRVWLQASTATIYAHRYEAPNDEASGRLGGGEPAAPRAWDHSIALARAWEAALAAAETPHTRKVALRSAMVMSPDRGGVFSAFATLCRLGMGRQGDGRQWVSWIHEADFVAAVAWLIAHPEIEGAVNVCAPEPLPNRAFIGAIHAALGRRWSVPAPAWLLELGAVVQRTETELLLKSRRVVPGRLREAGFQFQYPAWPDAARELVARWQKP